MITFHILGLLLGAILIANFLGDMLDSGERPPDRWEEKAPWVAPPPPRHWKWIVATGAIAWAYYLIFQA